MAVTSRQIDSASLQYLARSSEGSNPSKDSNTPDLHISVWVCLGSLNLEQDQVPWNNQKINYLVKRVFSLCGDAQSSFCCFVGGGGWWWCGGYVSSLLPVPASVRNLVLVRLFFLMDYILLCQ